MIDHNASTTHIEGMDLAGKSTATAALVAHLGAEVRHNALTQGNQIYDLADLLRRTTNTDAVTLGHLFVAALRYDLAAYTPPIAHTVQDSTLLLRSLAFNEAMGNGRIVEDLLDLADAHPRFTTSIVLTATIEARIGRLEDRRRHAPEEVAADDLLIHTNPRLFVAMEQNLVHYATTLFGATIIDTSKLSRSQVADVIKSTIECSAVSNASTGPSGRVPGGPRGTRRT